MGLYGETFSPFGKETLVDKEEMLCPPFYFLVSDLGRLSMRQRIDPNIYFLLLSPLLSAIASFSWVTSSFCHHFNSCLLLSASRFRKLSSTCGGRSVASVGHRQPWESPWCNRLTLVCSSQEGVYVTSVVFFFLFVLTKNFCSNRILKRNRSK